MYNLKVAMYKNRIILLLSILFSIANLYSAQFFRQGWRKFSSSARRNIRFKKNYSFHDVKSLFNRIKPSLTARVTNVLQKYKQPIKKFIAVGTIGGLGIKLKQSLAEYAKPEELRAIDQSLSYKMFNVTTVDDIKKRFEQLMGEEIKDIDFAMQKVIEALTTEQRAQTQRDFVAYHGMPMSTYLMLLVYTSIYNEKFSSELPGKNEDFIFLRTHETVSGDKYTRPQDFESGLAFWNSTFINSSDYKLDEKQSARDYLISLSPLLFAQGMGESALRTPGVEKSRQENMMNKIIRDILNLYNIDPEQKVGIFKNQNLASRLSKKIIEVFKAQDSAWLDENILLQIVFTNSHTISFNSLKAQLTKYKRKEGKLEHFFVGYDKNHVFQNLYWANPYGVSCDVMMRGKIRYNGAALFEKILGNKLLITFEQFHFFRDKAQLRCIVTPKLLNGGYTTHLVDIYNNEERLKKIYTIVLQEVKSVLREKQ